MSDVVCLFCRTANPEDSFFCNNCQRSLIVGKLTSLGTGVLTKGFVWELRPTNQTMGRNIGNDFVIPSNLVAGEQLHITFRENHFVIKDVSNRGNCLIDGEPLTDETSLKDGSTIKVGVEEFAYKFIKPSSEKVTKIPDPLASQLQLVLGIISEFHASLNLQEVLDNAIDAVLRLTRTKRGYCFMVDETPDGALELREVGARQAGGKTLKEDDGEQYSISQSIIQQVLSGSASVIVEDALAQNINTDTIRKFKLKSIVCVPLVTYNQRTGQKQTMGIIYADSLMPSGELPKHSRSTLQMLADIITSTIVKWQNYEKMESTFQNYQRSVQGIEQDLRTVTDQLVYLQERIAEPEQFNKINKKEINLELNAIESRIQSVWTSLQRLHLNPEGR